MSRADRADDGADDGRIRFDKWLWAARFYKTRSLCVQAIDAGQARVNGERAKPARAMRVGEAVSIRKSGIVCEVLVTALSDRRGGATDAAKLYRETEASAAAREAGIAAAARRGSLRNRDSPDARPSASAGSSRISSTSPEPAKGAVSTTAC